MRLADRLIHGDLRRFDFHRCHRLPGRERNQVSATAANHELAVSEYSFPSLERNHSAGPIDLIPDAVADVAPAIGWQRFRPERGRFQACVMSLHHRVILHRFPHCQR